MKSRVLRDRGMSRFGIATASLAVLSTMVTGAAPAAAAPPHIASGSRTIQVGALTLTRCNVAPGAYCGSIERPWGSGASGNVTVGFAYVPASDRSRVALGTLVPHEGGPGYSTTGSAPWFLDIYAPLMDRRNVLLVDQRGTGLSEPITCSPEKCPKTLGKRAYSYGTSASADDLAAVLDALGIDRIDMYGDSYGTFFAQVFAGRHGDRLRTLVLDGAYPVFGESAWYPTQGPALRHSFAAVCARSPMCAAATSHPDADLRRLVERLRRQPERVNAPAADGNRHSFWLYAADVAYVAYSATYGTDTYQQFTASVRSALRGDFVPLGRLVADVYWGGRAADNPAEYSSGLDYAVSCHDYPQVFDLSAGKKTRQMQYRAALKRQQRANPWIYAPFTIREYLDSGWSSMDMCMDWPRAAVPVGPPRPISGSYPAVPTMILSGELDTITTPTEGAIVDRQFPNSRQVVVANAPHVTSQYRFSCGSMILRHVVRNASLALPRWLQTCTEPDVRTVGSFARLAQDTQVTPGVSASARTRLASAVLATWGDVVTQWLVSPKLHGLGLRGGSWSARREAGTAQWTVTLDQARLSSDLPVSGRLHIDLDTGTVTASARIHAGRTTLASRWSMWVDGARARVSVTRASGATSSVTLLAP